MSPKSARTDLKADAAPILVWFRNDLRLSDHRALAAAIKTGAPIVCVYILDDVSPGKWKMGGASRWWLGQSLAALSADIDARGGRLVLRSGDARNELPKLAAEAGAAAVYFSRAYEPWAAALETDVREALVSAGVEVKRFAGYLLREPEDVRTKAGEPYKVYTPFWRALSDGFTPPPAISAPGRIAAFSGSLKSDRFTDWRLSPTRPNWAKGWDAIWQPGEAGAQASLQRFLKSALATYKEDRNRPDRDGTSRLSPHLHFGEISPAACWRAAAAAAAKSPGRDESFETFLKELTWRDFSASLLFHWQDLPEAPFREEFAAFPWRNDAEGLRAWKRGLTGYPIVDAGMRELWTTGYMHNRVRMVVASFLIKHLLIHWREGEAWFWDTLLDADLANNAASWQWVAGSGADAAPYFRIFNPVTQGEKFDPNGEYVKKYVPELAKLPADFIHAPWQAPADALKSAGVVLGKTYPQPIVDHGIARARALAAYDVVKLAQKA